jgi:hypothetical protein
MLSAERHSPSSVAACWCLLPACIRPARLSSQPAISPLIRA